MTTSLNLNDIQGNVIRAYGRFSFPFARYFFLQISRPDAGRKFVDAVRREVTTAARWPEAAEKPECTVNIGFSFHGLRILEIPPRTLQGMSDVFIVGMKGRANVLGDRDTTKVATDADDWNAHWDPIWRKNRASDDSGADNVHIWISLNAQLKAPGTTGEPVEALEGRTRWLRDLCDQSEGGVKILSGIGREGDQDFQAASAVFDAHGDMNVPGVSSSGNIHGMPLAHLLGNGDEDLRNILGFSPKVMPEKVALIGIRDIDANERKIIQNSGIHTFTMREIDEHGMATIAQRALEVVTNGTAWFHISFDVDGCDPTVIPGSGTPVPGGVSFREAHLLMEYCADNGGLLSMDVVELNPFLDDGNISAEPQFD